MSKPVLSILPKHREELTECFDDVMASLGTYFTLADAPNDADTEAARAVASALSGVVHSSDTDVEYYPCTLEAPEPTSPAFFQAVGVAEDARAKVSGWDNPKLEAVRAGKGDGERPAMALVTRLNEHELERISDYVVEEDQTAINAAIAELEAIGPVFGVQLCTDDGASKVLLTVATAKSGKHIGVLTIRVET
jgi:hypothetical protein